MRRSEPPAPSASARSLLLTLLGEFVYPSTDPVWTATLVRAFADIGVAEKATRQVLSRASTAGWIESGRQGREAWWSLSAAGTRLIAEGSQRVRGLRHADEQWTGNWLLLHVTLPESRRAERLRLYRVLQWLGFGSPSPGLWICPRHDLDAALQLQLKKLGLEADTLAFSARSLAFGMPQPELVQRAWDLAALAEHYRSLYKQFSALRPRTDQTFFTAHVQLVNAIQRLPAVDPGLPAALLPRQWEGARVTRKLEELRAAWREPAHVHWRRLSDGA